MVLDNNRLVYTYSRKRDRVEQALDDGYSDGTISGADAPRIERRDHPGAGTWYYLTLNG